MAGAGRLRIVRAEGRDGDGDRRIRAPAPRRCGRRTSSCEQPALRCRCFGFFLSTAPAVFGNTRFELHCRGSAELEAWLGGSGFVEEAADATLGYSVFVAQEAMPHDNLTA